MRPFKYSVLVVFTTFFIQLSYAQYDYKPVSEISIGLKVVNGNFIYGKTKYESTRVWKIWISTYYSI